MIPWMSSVLEELYRLQWTIEWCLSSVRMDTVALTRLRVTYGFANLLVHASILLLLSEYPKLIGK